MVGCTGALWVRYCCYERLARGAAREGAGVVIEGCGTVDAKHVAHFAVAVAGAAGKQVGRGPVQKALLLVALLFLPHTHTHT